MERKTKLTMILINIVRKTATQHGESFVCYKIIKARTTEQYHRLLHLALIVDLKTLSILLFYLKVHFSR